MLGVLFPVNGFAAATDWLFAKVPVRFPELRIVLSEGGIGWVPILLDRLSYMARDDDRRGAFGGMTPAEVFPRNFWFTTFSDERVLALRRRDRGGPHHVRDRLPALGLVVAQHPGHRGPPAGRRARGPRPTP